MNRIAAHIALSRIGRLATQLDRELADANRTRFPALQSSGHFEAAARENLPSDGAWIGNHR